MFDTLCTLHTQYVQRYKGRHRAANIALLDATHTQDREELGRKTVGPSNKVIPRLNVIVFIRENKIIMN